LQRKQWITEKNNVCVLCFFSLMDVEKSKSMCWSSISPEPSRLVTEEPQWDVCLSK